MPLVRKITEIDLHKINEPLFSPKNRHGSKNTNLNIKQGVKNY